MTVLVQLNKPSRDFEMIPRRLCRLGLTGEAVGLMVTVACAEDGAVLSAAWIEAETRYGRDKRQRVMRELVGAGLLRVRADQSADGRWSKTYVFDWDLLLAAPRPENPVSVARPPRPGNPASDRDRKTRSSRRPENPVIERTEDPEARPAPSGGTGRASGAVEAQTLGERPDGKPWLAEGCFNGPALAAKRAGMAYRDAQGQWQSAERSKERA